MRNFIFLVIMVLLLVPSFASCGVVNDDLETKKWYKTVLADDLLVGTSVTLYTEAVPLTNSEHHGLYVRTSSISTGVVNFVITAEYSIKQDSGFAAVATPVEFDTIDVLGNKPVKLNDLCFMPYVRFKIVSGATNAADVKLDMFLIRDSKQK